MEANHMSKRIARVRTVLAVGHGDRRGRHAHKHVHVAVADRPPRRPTWVLHACSANRGGYCRAGGLGAHARRLSRPLGSRAPGRTVSGWRASFAATPSGSSKSIIATGESDGTTGRVTRSTRRWPRGRYSPVIATAVPKSCRRRRPRWSRQIKIAQRYRRQSDAVLRSSRSRR